MPMRAQLRRLGFVKNPLRFCVSAFLRFCVSAFLRFCIIKAITLTMTSHRTGVDPELPFDSAQAQRRLSRVERPHGLLRGGLATRRPL